VEITKRSWFFHLLGLLALLLVFGVMLAGCDASTLTIGGGLLLGGIIGGAVGHIFIGIIVGGIIGFVIFCIISDGTSSSSSSGPSRGCSGCKYWDGPQQSKCNLTGDLYMNGCSRKTR